VKAIVSGDLKFEFDLIKHEGSSIKASKMMLSVYEYILGIENHLDLYLLTGVKSFRSFFSDKFGLIPSPESGFVESTRQLHWRSALLDICDLFSDCEKNRDIYGLYSMIKILNSNMPAKYKGELESIRNYIDYHEDTVTRLKVYRDIHGGHQSMKCSGNAGCSAMQCDLLCLLMVANEVFCRINKLFCAVPVYSKLFVTNSNNFEGLSRLIGVDKTIKGAIRKDFASYIEDEKRKHGWKNYEEFSRIMKISRYLILNCENVFAFFD
jgi:hypothetical protein